MHCLLLAAALPLPLAGLNQSPGNVILARQGGDSFKPGVDGITDNCAPQDLCGGGDNSPQVCLVRSLGDVCCAENYGCPGGSFCLTKGFCCPDGDDPNTCAAANGITLPPGFKAGQTLASGALTSSLPTSTSASSTPSVLSHTSPATISVSSPPAAIVATSTSVSVPIYSIQSNSSSHGPVVSPTGALVPSSTLVPFTGDASVIPVGLIGVYISLIGGYAAFLLYNTW